MIFSLRTDMRVNIREAVQISSHRYGRDALQDALPRDPAWRVSKLVFGFSHGRSRVSSAGARPYVGETLHLMLTRMRSRPA